MRVRGLFGCVGLLALCGFWACERPLVCREGEQLVQGRCAGGERLLEEGTFEKALPGGGDEGALERSEDASESAPEVVRESVVELIAEEISDGVMCRSGSLQCRDAQTAETCNSAGNGWIAERCEQGRVCIQGRCAVEGCGTEGSERPCYTGATGTLGVGLCRGGTQRCESGRWGLCVGEIKPEPEACGNNLDENCDGKADEGCVPANAVVGSWHRRNETVPPYRFRIVFLASGAYNMFYDGQQIAEGTYTLQGDQLEVLDAPGTNCTKSHPTQPKGVYQIVVSGDLLTIKAVRDLCFSREGFLTFDPWVKTP